MSPVEPGSSTLLSNHPSEKLLASQRQLSERRNTGATAIIQVARADSVSLAGAADSSRSISEHESLLGRWMPTEGLVLGCASAQDASVADMNWADSVSLRPRRLSDTIAVDPTDARKALAPSES